MLITSVSRRREVLIIILLAAAVRFWDIGAPFTSHHWIKQLQIAPIAKHFATKSMNILWPETDYSADKPGYIEIEFQLVTWLTAILYRVFGIHEWCARLVTISFSIGGMVLLYRLMLMYIGPHAAAYGLIFYGFVPSSWYFSRVLMSEPVMLFFSIAVMYAFSLYLATGSRRHYVWTAICGALCFLVKLPAVLLLIPIVFLAHEKYLRRLPSRKELWGLGALMVLPAVLYYAHARFNIGAHYFTVGVDFKGGMWINPQDFLDPGNYSLMLTRFVTQHLTAVGVVLLPLGALVAQQGRVRLNVFHVWLGAVVLYLFLVSGGNIRQNYYQLHILPPAAALIGIGWDQLLSSRRFVPILNPVLAALFGVLCVWGVEPMFEQVPAIHNCAKELESVAKNDKPAIIFPAGYGCQYYFSRPGWCGREGFGKSPSEVPPEDTPGPSYIDDRIERGAGWAVYFDFDTTGAEPAVQQYLKDTYRLAADGAGYEIFDLSTGPEGPSPPQSTPPRPRRGLAPPGG